MLTDKERAQIAEYGQKRKQTMAEAKRETIKTDKLLDTLQKYALDEKVVCGKMKNGKEKLAAIKMTPTRLKAIQVLLDKSLPDLASIRHEVEAQSVSFFIDTTYKPEPPEQTQQTKEQGE